jgi:hypothetical protein
LLCVLVLAWPAAAGTPADAVALERLRATGDLAGQRAHLWAVFAALVRPDGLRGAPAFTAWPNRSETFEAGPRLPFPGLPASAFAGVKTRGIVRLDAPVLAFVHFDPTADAHVRRHRLNDAATLDALRRTGAPDARVPGSRTIPPWPRTGVAVMSGWWPVASTGTTPLPVWDPAGPTRASGSNSYVNWPRVVAVDPAPPAGASPTASVEFAGRAFPQARRVGLDRFFRIPVDATTANRLMADESSRKAALIALGRPLRAGDSLVLVALHVMTAELPAGVWGTFWWHDAPGAGPFAAGRPSGLPAPWRHLLMDVAFDAVLPREPDGSPRVAFNPWFDAPFPGSAHANGLHSNCVNCHARAGYPALPFLPVRRGDADLDRDPAYAAGRLRTGQVWSVAHAGQPPVDPRHR